MSEAAYQLARRRILNNAVRRQQTSLNLCDKQLVALPPEIGFATTLEALSLRDNRLTVLPPELWELTGLLFLDLANNELTTLPPEVGRLTNLKELNIDGNQLTTLPPEIGRLTALRDLRVNRNLLTELPPVISRLTALNVLQIGNNQLTELPPEIGRLTALNILQISDNRLTKLSPAIGQLTELRALHVSRNLLTTLPDSIGFLPALRALVASGNRLTALPVDIGRLELKFLDVRDNQLPEPYPKLIFGNPNAAAENVLAWLRGELDPTTLPDVPGAAEKGAAAAPPPLPPQGVGPHFEIDDTGIVTLAPPEALDREGNHVRRLRNLHPTLRDLSRALVENLLSGNAPHGRLLGTRAKSYMDLVDQDLDKIDFARVYIEGVRLANAEAATILEIERRELPQLDAVAREQLSTILQLHGAFMLSTVEGIAAIELEEQYQRRPDEERQYRAAAVDVAKSLQNRPDIIDPSAASVVLGAAEEINNGVRPERSDVAGTGPLRNAVIAIMSVATVAALPVAIGSLFGQGGPIASYFAALATSEGLKRTNSFSKLFAAIAGVVDYADAEIRVTWSDAMGKFRKHLKLVRHIEPKLRRVVARNEQFSWIGDVLDWLKNRADVDHPSETEC